MLLRRLFFGNCSKRVEKWARDGTPRQIPFHIWSGPTCERSFGLEWVNRGDSIARADLRVKAGGITADREVLELFGKAPLWAEANQRRRRRRPRFLTSPPLTHLSGRVSLRARAAVFPTLAFGFVFKVLRWDALEKFPRNLHNEMKIYSNFLLNSGQFRVFKLAVFPFLRDYEIHRTRQLWSCPCLECSSSVGWVPLSFETDAATTLLAQRVTTWREASAAVTDPSKLQWLSVLAWTPAWTRPAAESGARCSPGARPKRPRYCCPSPRPRDLENPLFNYRRANFATRERASETLERGLGEDRLPFKWMSESLRRLVKVASGGETTMDSFDGAVPIMPPYDGVLYSREQTPKQSPSIIWCILPRPQLHYCCFTRTSRRVRAREKTQTDGAALATEGMQITDHSIGDLI